LTLNRSVWRGRNAGHKGKAFKDDLLKRQDFKKKVHGLKKASRVVKGSRRKERGTAARQGHKATGL